MNILVFRKRCSDKVKDMIISQWRVWLVFIPVLALLGVVVVGLNQKTRFIDEGNYLCKRYFAEDQLKPQNSCKGQNMPICTMEGVGRFLASPINDDCSCLQLVNESNESVYWFINVASYCRYNDVVFPKKEFQWGFLLSLLFFWTFIVLVSPIVWVLLISGWQLRKFVWSFIKFLWDKEFLIRVALLLTISYLILLIIDRFKAI